MKYIVDHNLHIHSLISPCAQPELRCRQTPEAILASSLTTDYHLICVTDHLCDRTAEFVPNVWLELGLDLEKGRTLLPLPQSRQCRFLFGMEVDMDYNDHLAVSAAEMKRLDFLVLAPSHLHLNFAAHQEEQFTSPEARKAQYLHRPNTLLNMDLPFEKCGLAHFICSLACTKDPVRLFELFTDDEYERLFARIARVGMGVELNVPAAAIENEVLMRPYRIAKALGCKFYIGGDEHIPENFTGQKAKFEHLVDVLGLEESDKLSFVVQNAAR